MRTLFLGLSGEDVWAWEYFLLGIDPTCDIIADGIFDEKTKEATKKFQSKVGFFGSSVDGVVGPKTLGKAMQLGFDPTVDERTDKTSSKWPPKPVDCVALDDKTRASLFGSFSYVSSPTPSNPEAITLTDDWETKNMTRVIVPQLIRVQGANKGNLYVNKRVVNQLLKTFSEWESAGLLDRVLTWNGMYSPRFIRGSRTRLSNHAWGTAFDINAQWNMLGTCPALVGQTGSTRELVDIAYQNGWYWGGWFGYSSSSQTGPRSDGMHFECFKLV